MTARQWLSTVTPERCVEWFVAANLAFLGVDIALAHAANAFKQRAEWAPIAFSLIATLLLVPMTLGRRSSIWRAVERAIGAGAILVGVVGVAFHLRSAFFEEQTLHNLVYSAPFVAPLAYVGVGLLLLLVRAQPAESREFAWWLVLLALGGFIGNLGLSLLDHAQNGFFRWTEWIPVIAAAFGASFLFVTCWQPEAVIVRATRVVLAVEATVGVLGFALHLTADLQRPGVRVIDGLLFGAPAFAPLLFTDLAALGAIALWATEVTGLPSSDRVATVAEPPRREAETHP
ncbi:MAG: hypothetical protein ABIQ16_22770 [Polyangiaceae bacterium]